MTNPNDIKIQRQMFEGYHRQKKKYVLGKFY